MQTQSSDVYVLIQPVNPLDIVQIATELRLMMLPELKTLFSEQLPVKQNMVKTAVKEANSELNKQAKQLDTEVKELKKENERLTDENNDMRERLSKIDYENDSLGQHGRRNSVRISGYQESFGESTDDVVLSVARELDVEIIKSDKSDTDRSHRVGKSNPQRPGRSTQDKPRPCDILVKFASYNVRQQLYDMRKDLQKSENEKMKNLFIHRRLDQKTFQLLYDAL